MDFARAKALAERGDLEHWKHTPGLGGGDRAQWRIPRDESRVVFLKSGEEGVDIVTQGGEVTIEARSSGVAFDREAGGVGGGRVYTSSHFDMLVELCLRGKISFAPGIHLCQGDGFQGFCDAGMDSRDWERLGFRPPGDNRPGLDISSGAKVDHAAHICLPHSSLEMAESGCPTMWNHFVDSSHLGAYFSRLEVGRLTHVGPTAGWPKGTIILPRPDFEDGVPYRRAHLTLQTCREGGGAGAGAVWHKGAQYLSFDPTTVAGGTEVRVKWKTSSGCVDGVFADAHKYEDAGRIRRTHYVPPRTNAVRFWGNGLVNPEPNPCILSPDSGAKYAVRPCPRERERLVAKYGRGAVPRNFNKYTEEQVAKKSILLRRVGEGGWVHIPGGEDGDNAVKAGYKKLGRGGLSWRILRQIAGPGDIESDPMGCGVYARLLDGEEVLESGYLRRIVSLLERDGWGFLLGSITENPDRLRRALLTMALS